MGNYLTGLKTALELRYPKQTGIYVVSQSVLDNNWGGGAFARAMSNYISGIPNNGIENSTRLGQGNLSIHTAMNFLAKVIENERAKESQFLEYINKESGLTPPSLGEDWSTFVKFFQEQLDFGQEGIKRLENELERLKNNAALQGKDIITKKGEELTIYRRERLDTLEYTSEALSDVAKFLSGSNNTIGKTIVELIYENYGERLINVFVTNNSLDIEINVNEANGLIMAISEILIEFFYNNLLNNKTLKLPKNKTDIAAQFKKEFENSFKQNIHLTNQINTIFNNAKNLPFYTKELASNYKLDDIPIQNSSSFINLKMINENNTDMAINNLRAMNKKNNYKPTIKLVKKTSALAELSSLLRQLAAGAITGKNTGSVGAKPDNTIAWLTIDYNNKIQTQEMLEDIKIAKQAIHDELTALNDTLKKNNTTEYYKDQQKNWNERANVIEQLLNELNEKYQILLKCFLIEDSTKNYASLYVGTDKNRKTNFTGGSLGANITDQINKIAALQDGGLITESDAQWLITAAINCGPGLIGSHLKRSLQNYLSAFAVILLFDDQQNIANEITQKIIDNTPKSQSSVTRLHLFSLDGGYYPLSLVLQLTYDKLSKIYHILDEETQHKVYSNGNYGAKVEIDGFINPDSYYPPGTYNHMTLNKWDELSEIAQASVKMHVQFLTNFMGLVNTILTS